MRNSFEQYVPTGETGSDKPQEEGKPESLEEESVLEIRKHIAERFPRLEELASQISVESGGTLSIAGVAVDQESISPEVAQKIRSLQERAGAILSKTARVALKVTRNAVLVGVLAMGYTAVDLNRQENFSYKETAKQELNTNGIPSDQRYSAYKPGISELLYRAVEPRGYQGTSSSAGFAPGFFEWLHDKGVENAAMLQKLIPNLLYGRELRAEKLEQANAKYQHRRKILVGEKNYKELNESEKEILNQLEEEIKAELSGYYLDQRDVVVASSIAQPALDDAWRIYLGLPQQHETFGVSEYHPSESKEDKYYLKLNNFWVDILKQWPDMKTVKDMAKFLESEGGKKVIDGVFVLPTDIKDERQSSDVMYHFTLSLGQDEKGHYISYYDKWDIASVFSENPIARGVGRPFEVYDRLYYDPVTPETVVESPQ